MIYKIERRSVFDGGTMESHYEVRQYERRTAIGVLVGGKTIWEGKTKKEAKEFCNRENISFEQ